MTDNSTLSHVFPDVMVDLETLSTSTTAMILSIGAVKFNRQTRQISDDKFYFTINVQSYPKNVFDIDPSTILWWLKQSDTARNDLMKNPRDVKNVLEDFTKWFGDSVYIWSHGSVFDVVILENAMKIFNIPTPWKFYNIRDTRTIYEIGKTFIMETDRAKGTYHNALDDAIVQTQVLFRAITNIRKSL